MKELKQLLKSGNYSCVIHKGEETRTFTRNGVIDLYELLKQEPNFLDGASVADKVIGKAAAALVISGKVKELYADLISASALELLKKSNIQVTYKIEVAAILNRTQNDWCPLEKSCYQETSLKQILLNIRTFIENINKK
jgi:hypothetical protein